MNKILTVKVLQYVVFFIFYSMASSLKASDDSLSDDFYNDELLKALLPQNFVPLKKCEDAVWPMSWDEEWDIDDRTEPNTFDLNPETTAVEEEAEYSLAFASSTNDVLGHYQKNDALLEITSESTQTPEVSECSSTETNTLPEFTIPAMIKPEEWSVRIANLQRPPYYKDVNISEFSVDVIPPANLRGVEILNLTLKVIPAEDVADKTFAFLADSIKILSKAKWRYCINRAKINQISKKVPGERFQFLFQAVDQRNSRHEFLTEPFEVVFKRKRQNADRAKIELQKGSLISQIKGIGTKSALRLSENGITTIEDLLTFDPNNAQDCEYLRGILSYNGVCSRFSIEAVKKLLKDLHLAYALK